MMKKSVFVMCASVLLAGCSSSEIFNPFAEDEAAIMLNSVAYDVSASTRAPFTGAIATDNVLKSRVVASTKNDFTTIYVDGTMIFNGGPVTYDVREGFNTTNEDVSYPASGSVWLAGLYPAQGWTGTTADYTFVLSGKEDVMVAEKVETQKSDVTSSPKTIKTLEFNHLLTKLEILLKSDAAASASFGKVNAISLVAKDGVEAFNTVKVNANTNVVAFSNSATVKFWAMELADGKKTYTNSEYAEQEYILTQDETYQAYAMVAPANIKEDEEAAYYLKLDMLDGKSHTVPVVLRNKDGETYFRQTTAGYSFDVTVYFQSSGKIMAEGVVVKEWKDGGSAIVPIEEESN